MVNTVPRSGRNIGTPLYVQLVNTPRVLENVISVSVEEKVARAGDSEILNIFLDDHDARVDISL